nr:hypothetical protein [Tanacetum cinerariifolium]
MYPRFLQLIIRKQVGDLSTHTTKYTSSALTQKVFANMKRVGKEFSGVETSLFEGLLVAQEVGEGVADEEHDEGVPAAGVVAKGDVSAAHDKVPTADEEPSIPSPTPPTPPPQPSHDIPSTSQLKRRVKKLERRNKVKVLQLRRLQKVGTTQRVETSDETVLDDVSNQGRMIAEMDQDVDVVIEDDKEVADDVKDEDESEQAKVQEVVDVVTTDKIITEVVIAASETITAATAPSRKRKGVVIKDPQEESTTSTIIPAETKSKDKEDPAVKKYQALKRKPHTDAQARKNMMLYLKNVAGFKMDYFKEMSYDDIRPIFEAKFNTNVAFLSKTKEQIKEEESRALKRLNETPTEKAVKRQKLDEEVEELKRHLQIVTNEDDDVYTEATPLAHKKNQRSVHGPTKVKGWKLLESYGVQIITFTTTQLILLVERKYPLTRFTVDQMLNAVRLEFEEASKVSLELLRIIRQQHQEGAQLE